MGWKRERVGIDRGSGVGGGESGDRQGEWGGRGRGGIDRSGVGGGRGIDRSVVGGREGG